MIQQPKRLSIKEKLDYMLNILAKDRVATHYDAMLAGFVHPEVEDTKDAQKRRAKKRSESIALRQQKYNNQEAA